MINFFIIRLYLRLFITTFFLLLLIHAARTQSPKREFRAVWVAHVSNTDWPTQKGLPADQQRNEFITFLDHHKRLGANAVVVQVRSACDAIYPSNIEPWSEWLTGKQGLSPNYDPLKFMVAEAHARGMEFHAWFNPYRAVTNTAVANIAPSHVSMAHPEWVRQYGSLKILDPGLPEVRAYVTRVVMDVVRRYDIDGVHFDDYFYPYPQTGAVFNDQATFMRHNPNFLTLADWRRNNVDLMVKMVADSISDEKPDVKFGISPFGIWKNKSTASPDGSKTRGGESYFETFSDSRKWVQSGWIDYIVPQLYWSIGFAVADYNELMPWWVANCAGRHLYIGQGIYRVGVNNGDANWLKRDQVADQIRLNRTYAEVKGSVHFSTKSLLNNPLNVRDSVAALYQTPALIPTMPWKDRTPPKPPTDLAIVSSGGNLTLRWKKPLPASDGDRARYFVVYRFEENETINLNNANAIRHITPTDTTAFTDALSTSASSFRYLVTAVDRLHNESTPSNAVVVSITGVSASKPKPAVQQNQQLFENETANADEPAGLNRLISVAPNPSIAGFRIQYEVAKSGIVNIQILTVRGSVLETVQNHYQMAGVHTHFWESTDVGAGTYILQLTTDRYRATRKISITK